LARSSLGTVLLVVTVAGVSAVPSLISSAAGAAIPQPVYFWGSVVSVIAGPGQSPAPEVVRPSVIGMFADGSWVIEHLVWTGWGTSVAHATGTSSASNDIPNAAQGKRINRPAMVALSNPGQFQHREVYRCFTLTVPSFPASNQHLCLSRTGSYWTLSPVQQQPTSVEFDATTIPGGCSVAVTGVSCETYSSTVSQHVRLTPTGTVTICTQHGTANTCNLGNFGEVPRYSVGKHVTVGPFGCQVQSAGVRCVVTATGKGFLVKPTTTTRIP